MNVEVLLQHFKATLSRHFNVLSLLHFSALALLLYVTSLLSQATSLSDLIVDLAIYTIYILLVLVIGSLTFITYCRLEEEPLNETESGTSERDVVETKKLLAPKDEKAVEDRSDRAIISSARNRLLSDTATTMRGFALVESYKTEEMGHYLSQQHPQIAALILLMTDLEKAEAILEHLEPVQRDTVLAGMKEMGNVSKTALKLLDEALQVELSPVKNECLFLGELESDAIREILRHVDKKELMFALKGATQELQEKFFVNMSSKASAEIRNILASVSSINQTKSQNAIKNLYLLAQQLRDNGKIRATNKATG